MKMNSYMNIILKFIIQSTKINYKLKIKTKDNIFIIKIFLFIKYIVYI